MPFVQSFDDIEEAADFGFPLIIKPRLGWGTREIYRVDNIDEARVLFKRVEDPVIQKYLDGKEYTIDTLTDKEGNFVHASVRERIKTMGGLSAIGRTVQDEEIFNIAKNIPKQINIIGPFNFQVRKSKKAEIFEINARFAGTGILSVHAGFNLPALAVKNFMGEEIPDIHIQDNFYLTRYEEGIYLNKEDLL